ncbi:hypothetical protein JOQ06_029362 [Pogonophryne albipinna]|uniref:FH2 domain-containing protein n=1 Tax=Pogonophryne albipinna TaxID=1090488 RepID=A0AAD6BD57_9TELE|nr:hypothetical protein JOQ06_029362 [Pogonophryne albipinna]
MTHSISVLYIYAADLWSVQQTSAHQLTSYCLSFAVSTHEPTMSTYISELEVSLNADEERDLRRTGFNIIDGNLNAGVGGNAIRLWYKYGSVPITKVQVSFNNEMADGLIKAAYKKIYKDLNAGAGGCDLYLWYSQGSGEFDTPIVEISVTTDAANEACEKNVQKVCANSSEENLQPFKEKMAGFVSAAQTEHSAEEESLDLAQRSFQDTVSYFGVKPKSGEKDVAPNLVFMLWYEFCNDFKNAWTRQNKKISKEKLKEAQENIKKITAEKRVETKKINANSLKERLRQKEAGVSSS